uniref:ZP domain-containing protein n=1 Tax=Heligmosomoides polygyrus TaxID=6339 RepID=A0A183GTG4_HELPZ
LFFEGFLLEPGCSSPEDSSREVPGKSRFDVQVKAAHGKCGLVKTYEARKRGFVLSSRAVLQFDRRFSSARDHSFVIRCSYPDKTKIAKSPRRAEGTTTLVQDAVQFGNEALAGLEPMRCSYNVTPVLQHCSTNSITVGATLLHTWKCDKEHNRFRVHSCFVIDPVTHRTEMVVDSNGCPVEDSIIGTMSYSADGAVSATGKATRFADVPVVRFSCRLRPCKGSSEQCAAEAGELPHCRSKRDLPAEDSVTFQPLSEVGEYDIAAYDDNVEGVMSAPERATRVMMEEAATQASQTPTSADPSTGPQVSLKSISSVTPPSFPLGGVDVKLNTKTVAVVASNLARDRLKEALQLRANSLSVDVSPAAARRLADGREQSLHVSESVRQEQSVLRVLTGNGLAVKQVKGFVRQLERPTTGQEEQHLVRSPTTERPPTLPTAAHSGGFELNTRKGIVRKEIRKRR